MRVVICPMTKSCAMRDALFLAVEITAEHGSNLGVNQVKLDAIVQSWKLLRIGLLGENLYPTHQWVRKCQVERWLNLGDVLKIGDASNRNRMAQTITRFSGYCILRCNMYNVYSVYISMFYIYIYTQYINIHVVHV